MHLLPALLIVLCITSLSFAEKWRPYVAFAGVMDIPSTEVSPKWFSLELQTSKYMYPGTVFEGGVRKGKHEWYAGYHLSHSPKQYSYNDYNLLHTDSSETRRATLTHQFLSEQRLLIGHRLWATTGEEAEFVPFVGLAIGAGYSRQKTYSVSTDWEYIYDSTGTWYTDIRQQSSSSRRSRDSDPALGGLIELGTAFRLWGTMELLVITQLHTYVTENKYWSRRYYDWQIMPSGVLQLRYVFR